MVLSVARGVEAGNSVGSPRSRRDIAWSRCLQSFQRLLDADKYRLAGLLGIQEDLLEGDTRLDPELGIVSIQERLKLDVISN